ncbi:MAG: hypothetical protein V3U54_02720 [Thermodesulfobacteriota bacterium]
MLNSFKYSNEISSNEKLESYISRVASTLIELTKNGFEVRFFLLEKTVFEAAAMTEVLVIAVSVLNFRNRFLSFNLN